MDKQIEKVIKKYNDYEKELEFLQLEVAKVCDFSAKITFCAGDRHLLLNEDTSSVAPLFCLNGKTESNKLTENEHFKCSI